MSAFDDDDDDYNKRIGLNRLNTEQLIAFIQSINEKPVEYMQKTSITTAINESIQNNHHDLNNRKILGFEFIQYVAWVLNDYYKILYKLHLDSQRNNNQCGYKSCVIRIHNIPLINYENIKNENIKNGVQRIINILRFLSRIDLSIDLNPDLQRYITNKHNNMDIPYKNIKQLFEIFGIKKTEDLSKFVIETEGGTRKNRRRKTSKVTKKHRKSSRRRHN
jgi:hypothetical protein